MGGLKFAEVVQELHFTARKVSDACGLAHGGDFFFVGAARHVADIAEHMGRNFKVKAMFTSNDHKN